MSYHAKKSTSQRSTGLIVVVVFHVILVWGLANGLAAKISDKIPEILKAEVVKEEIIKEVEPPPPPPDIKPPPPDFVPPPSIDFVPDAPAPVNAIVAVQKEQPKAQPSPMTKPKQTAKGLSKPEYPRDSIRLGEEGVTGLNLYITEDGKVAQAQVANSSGSERLDQAAVSHAQRSWKFVPCMQGDKPVACWHQLNFRWKIEDAKK